MSTRTIAGSTVVIVGATSGVGRAVARSLAASNANVVVMARDPADVGEVVDECRRLGASAVGEPGDIGRVEDLERTVATATRTFGSIDTWINAASGLIVGDIVDQPPADIIQVVQTNVIGTALASRMAIEHFEQRDAGVLINISSLLALIPNPLVPTYVMTKFAIRGLSLSLHVATAGTGIRVCTILPGPIDSPMFEHAANYSGRAIRAIPPAASPERVAAAVMRSVRRPRRQRTVGLTGALIMLGHHIAPRIVEGAVARTAATLLVRAEPAGATAGSLRASHGPGRVNGGWRRVALRSRVGDAIGRRQARRLHNDQRQVGVETIARARD